MRVPPGVQRFDSAGQPLVCKLRRSLYGLKQAGREWAVLFSSFLVDWGMARRLDKPSNGPLTMGTPLYASPEQLTGYDADQAWGRAKLSTGADIWALGVTLYEMLTGRRPFEGETHERLVANVLSLNYSLPDHLSLEARQLIDGMLQTLPCDRASLDELCCDPWTIAEDGPLPPPLSATPGGRANDEGRGGRASHDVESGRSFNAHGGEAGPKPSQTRRILLYLLYACVVAYALLSFARGGGSIDLDLEDDR